jgi:hypothetical protein
LARFRARTLLDNEDSMKRQRNRGHGGGGGGGHSNNYRGGGGGNSGGGGGNRSNVPFRAQTFDSNGPDVRIRGNAYQVLEKYLALARDASASSDRVAAENFYQHAEHYFRLINANQEPYPQQRPQGNMQQQAAYTGDPNAGTAQAPTSGGELPGVGPQPGPVVVHTNVPQPPQGDMQAAGPLPSFLGNTPEDGRS